MQTDQDYSRRQAQRGRIGALVANGRHGPAQNAAARAAFAASFEEQADPDGTLTPAERVRRAALLRRARRAKATRDA